MNNFWQLPRDGFFAYCFRSIIYSGTFELSLLILEDLWQHSSTRWFCMGKVGGEFKHLHSLLRSRTLQQLPPNRAFAFNQAYVLQMLPRVTLPFFCYEVSLLLVAASSLDSVLELWIQSTRGVWVLGWCHLCLPLDTSKHLWIPGTNPFCLPVFIS